MNNLSAPKFGLLKQKAELVALTLSALCYRGVSRAEIERFTDLFSHTAGKTESECICA